DQRRKIVGVRVHFVADPGLTRTTMAAPVVRDDSVAALAKEEHLVIPRIGGQRPAMAKNDRLALPPIFVIDLCSVFGCNGRHSVLLSITLNVPCGLIRES